MATIKSKTDYIAWCQKVETELKAAQQACEETKKDRKKFSGAIKEAAFIKAVEDVLRDTTALLPILSKIKGLSNNLK